MEPMKPDQVMYPHISISLDVLPEAKDWKIGKVYDVRLRLKQTGMHMSKGKDGKEMGDASFDIIGIEPGELVKGSTNRYVYEDTDNK